ncbi:MULTISPECIES: DUF5719 family protein [unclassified Microbacterium]|uniref:DUF5719 family protein n=1 Tax=unclassified Microbacterium TaxID=2609290 RepID=UPI00214B0591|nr:MULTISPECIES: DUF5719 family protein [unclassified Microbacterium]MCR2810232.1 DUF5719 family protein [Microbacterium sp. zg.B185]WIM19938.1 DUF5719 family protein [Microbacterium sp. zg-B185]
MSDRRVFRWASTSARLLVGTLVAIGFVIAVVTAVSLPWPTAAREPVAITAMPAPSASVVVCPGGLLALGRELEDAGRIVTAAPQTVISGVAQGRPVPTTRPLTTPASDGSAPATAVVAEPVDGTRTDVAASGSSTIVAEDLSGFAAAACRPALMESWLVGGSAATGASDTVLLANPGTVAATVQLTVFGASGPQVPAGAGELVVGPGAQAVLPLAGLQLGEQSPVIRVTATGAPVQAALQTSITRTLVPGGVDQVGATVAPDRIQVMPGVTVTQNPDAEGSSDAATVVRMLSPDQDTTAVITASAVGTAAANAAPTTVPLTAGIPTEVDLGGLATGLYTVEVSADTPVVAAVWQTTGFGEGADFAWYSAAPPVTGEGLFATPPGPTPVLTLANPTEEPVTTAVEAVDGGFVTEVTVAPGESASVRLSARTVYLLEAGGAGIRAGLSLTGDGALAGFPVWPSDAAAPQVTVYP